MSKISIKFTRRHLLTTVISKRNVTVWINTIFINSDVTYILRCVNRAKILWEWKISCQGLFSLYISTILFWMKDHCSINILRFIIPTYSISYFNFILEFAMTIKLRFLFLHHPTPIKVLQFLVKIEILLIKKIMT